MKRLFLAFAFVFVFTLSVYGQRPGEPGTPQCGGVQQAVQTTIGNEDPSVYKNHGAYVSAVSGLVNKASQAGLITGGCPGCIINQFARRVPVEDQTPCGPVSPPTQACTQTNPSVQQVQAATLLSLGAFSDPWSDVTRFQSVIKLANTILGCKLEDSSEQQSSLAPTPREQPKLFLPRMQPQLFSLQAQTQQCATPGVNYCGPGNSNTNSFLTHVNVPACLNDSCCEHDSCYGTNCVAKQCNFTPQSQTCDDPLIATCNGNGSCSLLTIFTSPMAITVCTIAECLNGSFPDPKCAILRAARVLVNPECNQPPSLPTCNLACAGQTCSNFTTCNPGSGCQAPVCGSLAEGGGACVEGTTLCAGLADCTTSADCGGGLCFVGSCCGRNVCVNSSAFCPDIGASASSPRGLTRLVSGPTIGRP